MSTPTPLIIRKRLRAYILARCAHWKIPRQRVPAEVIDTLAEDLERQVDVRVMAMLNRPPPPPREPQPRKPKAPTKRSLKNHPTLFKLD